MGLDSCRVGLSQPLRLVVSENGNTGVLPTGAQRPNETKRFGRGSGGEPFSREGGPPVRIPCARFPGSHGDRCSIIPGHSSTGAAGWRSRAGRRRG